MNEREYNKRKIISSLGKRKLPAIYFGIILLVILIIIFFVDNINFLSLYNIDNIGTSTSILLTVGLGQMCAILVGGIDLSVGGIMSLISVIFMIVLPKLGYWTYPLCLLIGIILGYINGNLLTRVRIPSFIATLSTGGIFVSIAYLISPVALSASVKLEPFLEVVNGSLIGIKNIMLLAFLLLIFFVILERLTIIGRHIFSVGSNVKMSYMSGLNVVKIKNTAFALSGFCAAFSGLLLASSQYSGYQTIGNEYVLMSIATVVVGGTALTGGIGGALNTLIGALIIVVIRNGMTVMGINIYFQQIILGLMIILGVAITFDRSKLAIIK